MKKVVKLTERDLSRIVRRIVKEGMENSEDCEKFQEDLQTMYDKYFKYLDSQYPYSDWKANDFKILLENLEESLDDIIRDARISGCDTEELKDDADRILSEVEEDLSRFM
jgi:hypothetical protein